MLLFATFFMFAACSSDDDDDTSSSGIKENIVGTWDATSVKFEDSDWIDITSMPSVAMSVTFNSDGTYYGRGALGNGGGTYTVSDNSIMTYVDGELYGVYVVKSMTATNAELLLTMDGETMEIKAKKR